MFTVEYKTRKRSAVVIAHQSEEPPEPAPPPITISHCFVDGITQQQITNGRLSAAAAGVIDALFRPLAIQIGKGIGDLDRRNKVRDLIRNTFNGMSAHRDDEVRVAFYVRRNTPMIIIAHQGRWWVDLKPTYLWEGRNGVSLVGVDCHTTFHVPDAEHEDCAAWFECQRDRLDAHFAKRLASPAPIQGEVQ